MSFSDHGKVAAVVVAAGRGSRAGNGGPKQYRSIGGRSVLSRSLECLLHHPRVDRVLAVIHRDDRDLYDRSVAAHAKLDDPVTGGEDRQESVRLGLEALAPEPPEYVLIHDAARPFLTIDVVDRILDGLEEAEAVLPTVPIADTLKLVGADGLVEETVPRDRLHAAQTPQGFRFATILSAHRRAAEDGSQFTDDAGLAEAANIPVKVVTGDRGNTKITTAADIADAERVLSGMMITKVGSGYDVHAFTDGDHVTLGGIAIPHDRALLGHSDADVVLHALTDAILATIGDGDIGTHFPPSDPALRGAASDRFLRDAVERLQSVGGRIVHLDTTVIAEAPKIGPHRDEMRSRIAEICAVPVGSVSVKATTNEGLGFVGRREGIAALATVTVQLPPSGP